MKSNSSILKACFFLWATFFVSSIAAQEACNCEVASKAIKENWVDEKDSTLVFAKIQSLKNSKFKSCVFEGLQIQFNYYISNRESKKAYAILQKQQDLLSKMKCKGQYDFAVNSNKAFYYKVINDLEKLSIYAFKSLKEAEKSKGANDQIAAIKEVVFLLTRMNEHQKKWTYVLRAQKLIESQDNSKQKTINYLWLAMEYDTKYTLSNRKTLLDSMALFANKAKESAFKYKLYTEVTNYYRIKESCSYRKGDVKNALKNMDSAIFYAKKIEGYKNLCPLYSAKAWDHLDNGQIAEANKSMDTALVLAKDVKDSSAKMMLYYDASDLYSGAKNVAKAFEVYKVYSKMKDSVWNIKKVEKVNELEQKYNKVKNEKMIFELEKTKQWYTFLIIGGLLTILTLVFFFRQRSLQNKQKIIETEQRLNRARINPHFFFNAMASLQNVSLEEKSSKTTLFISRFAKIMRQSLESTYEELVTIESELEFMTDYLELQKLRFPDKFEYQFDVDDSLEINELKIPGMLLQPFIENAIEHGFKDINYKGNIVIVFEDVENHVAITVKDNGKGQTQDHVVKDHKSRAMQIVKDRIYLFNKQHHSDAFYQVLHTKGESGFKIVMSLPKIY
ncbi:histidine kinase [Flavobacterium sp.]|uniref:sensor histidine kinase n=1 Tax=Flavobacterium sp. TaxID=239 RepID=UPI00286CDB33|nr:histidine kinase [Flavobacterium sp.]